MIGGANVLAGIHLEPDPHPLHSPSSHHRPVYITSQRYHPILSRQPSVVHTNMSDVDTRPMSTYYCHDCQKWHGQSILGGPCTSSSIDDSRDYYNKYATENFHYKAAMVEPSPGIDSQPAPASTMSHQRDGPDDHHSQTLDHMPHTPPVPSLDDSLSSNHSPGNLSVEVQTPPRDIWRREGPRPGPTVCPEDLKKRLSEEINRLSKKFELVNFGDSSPKNFEGHTPATVTRAETGHPLSASALPYRTESPMDIDGRSFSDDDSSSVGHASGHGDTTSQSLHSTSEEGSEVLIAGSDRSPSPAADANLYSIQVERQQIEGSVDPKVFADNEHTQLEPQHARQPPPQVMEGSAINIGGTTVVSLRHFYKIVADLPRRDLPQTRTSPHTPLSTLHPTVALTPTETR